MKLIPAFLIAASALGFAPATAGTAPAASAAAFRCGWFDNPTPANAWLNDRDGEWIISIQGGHQAKGKWPRFASSQVVQTNAGSYGYGCACMKIIANTESREVSRIVSANARPLAACRKDKALTEPDNPLK